MIALEHCLKQGALTFPQLAGFGNVFGKIFVNYIFSLKVLT